MEQTQMLSTRISVALVAGLFLVLPAVSRAEEDYAAHIKNLRAGTAREDANAAIEALEKAGTAAFPALIEHFADQTEAAVFQEAAVERGPDGKQRLKKPRIGRACFLILQGQIEGHWPKGFTEYHTLTSDNAKAWLAAREKLTLRELQRESLTQSLRRAEADLAKEPMAEYLQDSVAFLKKRLAAVEESKGQVR
jgi:hypothetical protein